ncbi:KdsC family phosphatase [Chloroflexota bacterium]
MKTDFKAIKLVVMDVDGVLTDGRIVLGKEEELKLFDIKDGMGITIARHGGLKTGIITGRTSEAVRKRAAELKFDYVIQGNESKLAALDEILSNENLGYHNVAYIGDDIIDIPVFRKAGFSATVPDAPDNVKAEVSYVSQKAGGRGAVREIVEYILKNKGVLDTTIKRMIDGWTGGS